MPSTQYWYSGFRIGCETSHMSCKRNARVEKFMTNNLKAAIKGTRCYGNSIMLFGKGSSNPLNCCVFFAHMQLLIVMKKRVDVTLIRVGSRDIG